MNSGAFYPDVAAPYAREYWDAFIGAIWALFSLAAICEKIKF